MALRTFLFLSNIILSDGSQLLSFHNGKEIERYMAFNLFHRYFEKLSVSAKLESLASQAYRNTCAYFDLC